MELRIKWTNFSKKELRSIFEYYKETAGIIVAKEIVSGIAKETFRLRKHPEIGQEEDLLKNDPR